MMGGWDDNNSLSLYQSARSLCPHLSVQLHVHPTNAQKVVSMF